MAPFGKDAAAEEASRAHLELLDKLDINHLSKPFRAAHWRVSKGRNKNIKQILGDSSRREASLMTTQDNSGAATPFIGDDSEMSDTGESTPARVASGPSLQPNLAQASQNLQKLVLERNMRITTGFPTAPTVTYTNLESAPSMSHSKHYCDITGLPAPYTDPKSRLRYHDRETFGIVRSLGQGVAELYLEARGAHTVLK